LSGGQVEAWLNRLLDSMKATVCHEMREAVVSYEEKPREVWVFEPPAQVALCAVQIWWTVETNLAFLRLEEGFENSLKDFNKKQVRAHTRKLFFFSFNQCTQRISAFIPGLKPSFSANPSHCSLSFFSSGLHDSPEFYRYF